MTFAAAALLLFSFVGAPHVPGQHVQPVEGQACSASLDAPLRLRRLLGASKLVRTFSTITQLTPWGGSQPPRARTSFTTPRGSSPGLLRLFRLMSVCLSVLSKRGPGCYCHLSALWSSSLTFLYARSPSRTQQVWPQVLLPTSL